MKKKTPMGEELYYILEETKKQIVELRARLDVLLEKLEEIERECLQ